MGSKGAATTPPLPTFSLQGWEKEADDRSIKVEPSPNNTHPGSFFAGSSRKASKKSTFETPPKNIIEGFGLFGCRGMLIFLKKKVHLVDPLCWQLSNLDIQGPAGTNFQPLPS